MKSFYPKGNWVKWKSRIEESVESLIKWAFEKTVNKSWQNRWANNKSLYSDTDVYKPHGPEIQDCAAYFLFAHSGNVCTDADSHRKRFTEFIPTHGKPGKIRIKMKKNKKS